MTYFVIHKKEKITAKNFEEISKINEIILNELYNARRTEIKEREPLKKCKITKRIKNDNFG